MDVFNVISRDHFMLKKREGNNEYISWFGNIHENVREGEKYIIKLRVAHEGISIDFAGQSDDKITEIRKSVDKSIRELWGEKYKGAGKSYKITNVNVQQEIKDSVNYQKGPLVNTYEGDRK